MTNELSLIRKNSELHRSLFLDLLKFVCVDDAYKFATESLSRITGIQLCSN